MTEAAMADAARPRMTPEEFFVWQDGREEPFEPVDGVPVPKHRMMTRASVQHGRVTVNVIISLGNQLRGSRCRPTTDDVSLRTSVTTIRRPDVTVACGEMVYDTHEARKPRLVVGIASPSTTTVDRTVKLEEYKRDPALRYILLLETVAPVALLYHREAEGWRPESLEGLEAVIDLPEIGASRALADIYDDLPFAARITDAMR